LRRWQRVTNAAATGATTGWLRAEELDGQRYRGLLAMLDSDNTLRGALALLFMRTRWWKLRPRTPAWAERYGGQFERVQRLLPQSLALRWIAGAGALTVVFLTAFMAYWIVDQQATLGRQQINSALRSASTLLTSLNTLLERKELPVAAAKNMLSAAQ